MKWIKASNDTPDSWHNKAVRFIHTKAIICAPEIFLASTTDLIDKIEWLDESIPASAEDEAARMYPYVDIANSKELTDMQRSAHITCAGMYTDTINKLKAEVERWKDEFETAVLELRALKHKHNL